MRAYLEADGGQAMEAATRPEGAEAPAENALGERTGDFGPRRVRLDHELSGDTAMLCVKARHGRRRGFDLYFHYRGEIWVSNKKSKHQRAPSELVLGRLTSDLSAEKWKELFHKLKEWCGYQRALNSWLGDLLENERARLIVFDVTGYEIPWELFYRRPPRGLAGRRGWIGAMIPVSRWTSLPYEEVEWNFGGLPQQAKGGLLMMEDAALRAGPETDAYRKYEVADREPALSGLIRLLEGEDGPSFALLMIRCHGERTEYDRLALNGVLLEELVENDLLVLRRNSAIVLLNACISARPATGAENRFWAPTRSFAEKFLDQGASGVIATMGDIDRHHSHVFATRFVNRAGKEDLNPASHLRDHRKILADHMQRAPGGFDGRSADDYKTFFWSFMYVYFGHPDTTLRLLPKGS